MDDLTKFALAAGISIPVARKLHIEYKKRQGLNKYVKPSNNPQDKKIDDFRTDLRDVGIDIPANILAGGSK